MEKEQFDYDVFLSYARADDEPFVKRLYEDLTTKYGKKVWWDRECMPSRGLTFLQEIRDAIDSSERLVAVVGKNAVQSETVKAEWSWAAEFGSVLVPILRDEPHNYELIPEKYRNLHCVDFSSDIEYHSQLDSLLRVLSEPLKPLGKFNLVPVLPPNYFGRDTLLELLTDYITLHITDVSKTESSRLPYILHGMGGIGKTVITTALARNTKIRHVFHDGIFWIPMGNLNNLKSKVAVVDGIRSLGISFKLNEDEEEEDEDKNLTKLLGKAQKSATEFLKDKSALIILDDVWNAEHLKYIINSIGPKCRLVITSRFHDIVEGKNQSITILDEQQSINYLSLLIGLKPEEFPEAGREAITEVNGHIFSLTLIGAMARSGTPLDHILEALKERDLEFMKKKFVNYDHPDLLRMIQVSIDFLEENIRTYLFDLAIFENSIIPEPSAIQWLQQKHGIKERYAALAIARLENNSLLSLKGVYPKRGVWIHDLIYDYITESKPFEINDSLRKEINVIHEKLFLIENLEAWKTVWGGKNYLSKLIRISLQEKFSEYLVELYLKNAGGSRTLILKFILVGNSEDTRIFGTSRFQQSYKMTVGMDSSSHEIRDFLPPNFNYQSFSIRFSFWDIATQERFDAFREKLYKGSQAVILVFNSQNSDSLFRLLEFMKSKVVPYLQVPKFLVNHGLVDDVGTLKKSALGKDEGELVSNDTITSVVEEYQFDDYFQFKFNSEQDEPLKKMCRRIMTKDWILRHIVGIKK